MCPGSACGSVWTGHSGLSTLFTCVQEVHAEMYVLADVRPHFHMAHMCPGGARKNAFADYDGA